MSTTSRLWRILQAQIGARFRKALADEAAPPFEKGAGKTRAGPGRSAGRAGGPRAAQDPVLARYYANLEVPYGSDLETVEKARKRLLRQYHPDRHATDPERQRIANELVKQLNHAYAELRRTLEKPSA